jgi:hypothetical protein
MSPILFTVKRGGVLFSVIKNLPVKSSQQELCSGGLQFYFAIIAALFSNLQYRRGLKEFLLVAAGLVIVRFLALYQSRQMQGEMEIFSPNLYADFGLFNSLADLLINNILIFFLVDGSLYGKEEVLHLQFKRAQIKGTSQLDDFFA